MTNELRETSRFPPDRAGVPRYPLRPLRHPGERIPIDRGDANPETAPDAVDPRCRFHSHPGRQPSNPPVLIDEGKILRVGDTATLDHDHLDTVRDTGRISPFGPGARDDSARQSVEAEPGAFRSPTNASPPVLTRLGTDQNPTIYLYTCERARPEARSARVRSVLWREGALAPVSYVSAGEGGYPSSVSQSWTR